MIVDELILKLQADLTDVKKALKQLEDEGKERGKKTGQGFADAFNAILGGALAAKVTGFLRSSVAEFNKLEKTMLGLQATAKLTGNSFDALKKSVTSLASDGVLSIDQASTSMKTLIAQGIQADKAFQLLDAAKKVSSFNNIVGDAGQGVADFVKFLQTGSAELAENMDPSIIKVVKSLGGYAKVSSDATAKQKLINAVIEKGGKLAGDYEKFLNSGAQAQVRFDGASLALSQTLGQKLQPAYTAVLNVLTKIIETFTDLLSGVSSATATFGALAVVIPIATFALGKFAATLGFSFAAALGPIGLVLAGVMAVSAAIAQLNRAPSVDVAEKQFKERQKSVEGLMAKTKELEALNVRTAKQERELVESKEELRKKAKELGIDYDKLIEKAGGYAGALKEISKAARQRAYDEENAPVLAKIASVQKRIDERTASKLSAIERYGPAGVSAEQNEIIARLIATKGELQAQLITPATETATGTGGKPTTGGGPGSPEFRFIRARDELRKLDQEYKAYIDRVGAKSPEGQEALTKLGISRGALTNELKQATAEYIEDRTEAALFAEQQAYQKARENIFELANAEKLSKEEVEKRLQKAKEANIRRNAQIEAQSFAATLQGANAAAGGFAQLIGSRTAGGALSGIGATASGLSGLKELFPALGALGGVGAGIGAAGGIVSTLTSLWDKSDEERAREAEQQKRRDEEAKSILELQANYQKNMLALQESQAKLPFQNLTRQLRLIDIQASAAKLSGGDAAAIDAQRLEQRQQAMRDVLGQEAGTIGQGQLFQGVPATPEGLTQFIKDRAAQATAVAQFMALIQQMNDPSISSGRLREILSQMQSYSGKIPQELLNAGVSGLSGSIDYLSQMEADYAMRLSDFQSGPTKRKQDLLFGSTVNLQNARSGVSGLVGQNIGAVSSLTSEIARDTSTADDLLSVIEQSNQTQLEIATNTKKTAENTSQLLRPDRQRSFIDVGQGFISSLGQRISPSGVGIARSLSQQGLSLPSEIGLASTTSTLAKTLQERMAEAMEMQARNGARANDLLSGILRATIELYRVMDGNPATVSGFDNAAADAWLADRERRRF